MTSDKPTAAKGVERNWKRIRDFSENEREIICERHFGWEKAHAAQLAEIFETTPQTITTILRRKIT